MSLSNYVYNRKVNGYGLEIWSDKMNTVTLFNQLHIEFYHSLEHIANSLPEKMASEKVYYYTMAKKHAQFILDHGSLANPATIKNSRDSYGELIRKYDSVVAAQRKEEAAKRAAEMEKQRAEQQAKNEAYWSEHAEEKQQLESELENLQTGLKELETQLAPFEKEIEALKDRQREGEVPSEKEKDTVLAEISRIRQEQGKLGLFKGKEKKALQAQIDELTGRLSTINESIESERKEQQKECNAKIREVEERAKPIKDKITTAQKRINEIKAELTKDR
ncbi:MAG: hypothetical protein IK999_01215 [Ruminococcus sp.]|nr:hypothetical protein [Ruminococcus sp.]